jgi:capsular exopolysaccharide synthesis family protein
MSRLHEALQKSERERRQAALIAPDPVAPVKVEEITKVVAPPHVQKSRSVNFQIPAESRLVALAEPFSLGAEKFRVLVTRLENLRKKQKDLKSLQVTSGGIAEGKTLVSGNLALTLAKGSRSRVLLIEGDLHNPKLASVFGLGKLSGLINWWSAAKQDIDHSLHQLHDLPLWFLPAGGTYEQPSSILQSPRFAEAFAQLSRQFDWIVVDSTPIVPMVDVNLWSRLVDGTLLVVREGVAPVKAIKKGLASLDNPKLVGVVFNDTSEFDHGTSYGKYYVRDKEDKNEKNNEMENGNPEVLA